MEKHIKGYSFLRGFLGFGFKLVYQIKITGKDNIPVSGPVVVCGNHNHVHDQFPVILSTKRMIHYMAKKEYFDGKMAWFFKLVGCIPVDRSIKDHNATDKALKILEVDLTTMLTDEQALEVPYIFPKWEVDVNYVKDQRVLYQGVLYKVLQDHKSQAIWKPTEAVSLFAKVLIPDPDVIPDWEQPDSTNAYMKGDKVSFNGKVYASLIDNNTWSPADYPAGWEELA